MNQPLPATSAHSHDTPIGLDIQYNNDLRVSKAFLDQYPSIRDALNDDRLLEAFDRYDRLASDYKRKFHLCGLFSLILGSVPLIVAALRMVVSETYFARAAWVSVVAELCAVASVSLIVWSRRKRYRVLWCQAVFCRERLRQWHFGKFLDGRLIDKMLTDIAEYRTELDTRWQELQQNLQDGYGMMVEFMRNTSRDDDLFHVPTEYADETSASQVNRALMTLRFEHQLRYSRRKTEPEGEAAGLALEERTALSETIASVSLGGAVLVSALALVVSACHLVGATTWLPFEPLAITRCLGGTALLLAVLSAASRAYRAGYTLPDESESYDEYCDRIGELKAVFQKAPNQVGKSRALEQLEQAAADELRRFLRMKTRATFVS
jgi:hypothetical protein